MTKARNAFDTVHFRCVCREPSVGSIEKIEVRKLVLSNVTCFLFFARESVNLFWGDEIGWDLDYFLHANSDWLAPS